MLRAFETALAAVALAVALAVTAPLRAQAEAHVVFGADLTPEERAEVAALLGVDPEREAAILTLEQLDAAVLGTGLPASPDAQSRVSAVAGCLPQGSGVAVRAHNTGRIPAAMIAVTLVTSGVTDAAVTVARPAGDADGAEMALVAAVVAASACRPDAQQAAERLPAAFELAARTLALAGQRADPSAVSATLFQALNATVAGGGSEQSAAHALHAALSAAGLPLDPVTGAGLTQLASRIAAFEIGNLVLEAPSSSDARLVAPARAEGSTPPVAAGDLLPDDEPLVAEVPERPLERREGEPEAAGRSVWLWLAITLLLVGGFGGGIWYRHRRRTNSFVLVPSQYRRLEQYRRLDDASTGSRRDGGVPWR